MNTYEETYRSLEEIFSIEKIKADLYNYYELSENGVVEIISYDHSGKSEKKHSFSRTDKISLYIIRVTKKYHGLFFFPYTIEIIVGDFSVNANTGILHMDKFRAELMYDASLQISTTDYFHVQ